MSPVLALCSNCCQLINLCFQKSFSLGTNLQIGPAMSAAISRSFIACVHVSNWALSRVRNTNFFGEKSTPNLLKKHENKRLRNGLKVERQVPKIQEHDFVLGFEYCERIRSQNRLCVLLSIPPIIAVQTADFCTFRCSLGGHQ